jgi:hypothetical protein
MYNAPMTLLENHWWCIGFFHMYTMLPSPLLLVYYCSITSLKSSRNSAPCCTPAYLPYVPLDHVWKTCLQNLLGITSETCQEPGASKMLGRMNHITGRACNWKQLFLNYNHIIFICVYIHRSRVSPFWLHFTDRLTYGDGKVGFYQSSHPIFSVIYVEQLMDRNPD